MGLEYNQKILIQNNIWLERLNRIHEFFKSQMGLLIVKYTDSI